MDAATEEDSADAHYDVVQAEDRSWPLRWTMPSFNQTWRRRTTPGQRDATINPYGGRGLTMDNLLIRFGARARMRRALGKDEEEKDEIILLLLVPW